MWYPLHYNRERDMPKRELNLKRLNYAKHPLPDLEDTDDKRRRKSKSKNSNLSSFFQNYQQQETKDILKLDSMLEKRNLPPIQRQNTERTQIIETFRGKKKWRICDECSKIVKFTKDSQLNKEVKRRKEISQLKPEDRCVICDKNEAFITEVDSDQDNVLLSLLYPRDFYDKFSREDKTTESLFNKGKNATNLQPTPLKPPKGQNETQLPTKRTYTSVYSTKDNSILETKTNVPQRKEFHSNCLTSNIQEYYSTPAISRISGDEFSELYRRQGFRGWKLQKDKLLYPPEAFSVNPGPTTSSYSVSSLGLHFDIPDHYSKLTNRNLSTVKHVHTNTGTKPKSRFPPIKTEPPWSGLTGRMTL